MSKESDLDAGSPEREVAPSHREIRFEYSRNFASLLTNLNVSLLVSTYQAGKLVIVGVDPQGGLALSFHNFERAMGVGVRPDRLAVGTLTQIWFLRSTPDIARRLEPAGRHDACFLARILLLDSGTGRLVAVDPVTGQVRAVAEQPGYTRGLALFGEHAFIGLSKIRETSTFGGVPIAQRRESLRCGVGVVELATGRNLAHLEFKAGVDEIFDVQVLPAVRLPAVSGPFPGLDGAQTIWTVPDAAGTEGKPFN